MKKHAKIIEMDLSHIENIKHRYWPDRTSTRIPCSMYGKMIRQKPIKWSKTTHRWRLELRLILDKHRPWHPFCKNHRLFLRHSPNQPFKDSLYRHFPSTKVTTNKVLSSPSADTEQNTILKKAYFQILVRYNWTPQVEASWENKVRKCVSTHNDIEQHKYTLDVRPLYNNSNYKNGYVPQIYLVTNKLQYCYKSI